VQKPKLSTIELVFVLIAVVTIFGITVHQMSTAGVLPGNDPAVHLAKAKQIIIDERVSYSEVAWYPPFLHTIVAMLQIIAGNLDVMVAVFFLKILIAIFNVLLLLSTYLLTRKLFGTGTAVASAVFTIFSVPLIEMIFWGGYANFMGLAYIAFVFYIMSKELEVKVKTVLLFTGTFTLVLSHQLTAFVFVLMFVPVFLINSIGSKRKFIAFLAVVVGGGLALLAWYARIIIEYADIIIEHIFYTMEENIYQIPLVGFDALTKNLGASLFLALAGIPIMFFILKKKKALKDSMVIIFWFAVPFILAESYLLGIHLPYNRFIYFFATPIAILSGVTTYFGISNLHTILESRILPKITNKTKQISILNISVLAIIFSLFFAQAFVFVQRIETYPEYYERAPISSYYSGLWVKQHSAPDGTVITSRSPGTWFYTFSDHPTIQETDPLVARSTIAEAVLYSFYEIENSLSLTREFDQVSPNAGQAIYVSRFNVWTKVLSLLTNQDSFIYVNHLGAWVTIHLNATKITIYWIQNSTDTVQLVSEYAHELFTVEKVVTFSSNSPVINIRWNVKVNQQLANVKLNINNFFEPSLKFKEALVPGVLEWQNPWDNASYINVLGEWAVIEGNKTYLTEKSFAVLDTTNGILVAMQIDERPDFFIMGSLQDRRIDTVKLHYEFGYLDEYENKEISYSILAHAYELEETQRWTISELKQQFDSETYNVVQGRDFLTYIEEYDIKFVAVDTKRVVSNIKATPALDKIYDNGRVPVYTTKR